MTSFKFPPPPPPPPKAVPNSAQPSYPSQRGGSDRRGGGGIGDSGRGRGRGGQGRGRGNNSSAEGSRGGRGRGGSNNAGSRAGSGRGDSRGGNQNNRGDWLPRGGSNAGYGQHLQQDSAQTNGPFFANPSPPASLTQLPIGPDALAHAMAFINTPASAHSLAAFASHMAQPAPSTPAYTQPAPRYSPTQQAGQKRKLNDGDDSAQLQRKPPQPKPPRAKAAVAPPVPNFGFSLPTSQFDARQTMPKVENKKEQNRRKVYLGLGQDSIPDESSEDEGDVDEEAVFADKIKFEGVAFEHEGESISLQTPAEVAAWRKDRKRNFPTQQRAAEKAQEAATKRASELEFLNRIKRKPSQQEEEKGDQKTKLRDNQLKPNNEIPHTKSKDHKDHQLKVSLSCKKQGELAALRKKLHQSMLAKQATSSSTNRLKSMNLNLGYNSDTDSNDDGSSILSSSSALSPSEPPSPSSSSSSSDDDEDDAPPTQQSTKVALQTITIPRPPPTPLRQPEPEKRVCVQWKRVGKCAYGHSCRFLHPEERRKGLFEVMVEQELVRDDELAREAIKYLGRGRFLG